MPTTSPRRRPDKPVRSVSLKVTFRAGGEEARKLMEAVPSARVNGGHGGFQLDAQGPVEMVEKAEAVVRKLKAGAEPRKALSRVRGRAARN